MFTKARSLVGLLAGLTILLAACRPSTSDVATETADPNAVFTAAAATANFRMTEIAAGYSNTTCRDSHRRCTSYYGDDIHNGNSRRYYNCRRSCSGCWS